MFTGIIEEIGFIREVRHFQDGRRITIKAQNIAGSLIVGASIAVDGVCQTVVELAESNFVIETVGETLKKTTLKFFSSGRKINLERALPVAGKLDGHLVQGHVSGIGRIAARKERGDHFLLEINVPEELCRYLVAEGSVAIDGVSLTVASIQGHRIGINLIPHTVENCTLGYRKAGDMVNVETDILGRYIEKLIETRKGKLSQTKLKEWGYKI